MIDMSRPEINVIIELEVVNGSEYVTLVGGGRVAVGGQEQLQGLIEVVRGVLIVASIFKHI